MVAAGAGVCGEYKFLLLLMGKHSQARIVKLPCCAGAAHHYYVHGTLCAAAPQPAVFGPGLWPGVRHVQAYCLRGCSQGATS